MGVDLNLSYNVPDQEPLLTKCPPPELGCLQCKLSFSLREGGKARPWCFFCIAALWGITGCEVSAYYSSVGQRLLSQCVQKWKATLREQHMLSVFFVVYKDGQVDLNLFFRLSVTATVKPVLLYLSKRNCPLSFEFRLSSSLHLTHCVVNMCLYVCFSY